jgi:hypothetical protein
MGLAEAFVVRHRRRPGVQRPLGRRRHAPEETVVLSVLSGTDALYVGVKKSARPLGLAFNVGMRLPAYLSGSGKAMLAWLPADEVRRRFAAGWSTRLTTRARATSRRCSRSWRWRAARLQHRRRGGARRRLFVRRAGVRRLRRGRRGDLGLHQQGAARQRSRQPPSRPALASPPTCRAASAATPGRRGGSEAAA